MYFAGVNLDLDNVMDCMYPFKTERAYLVAKHPVAAARFFDRLIQSIIDTMSIGVHVVYVDSEGFDFSRRRCPGSSSWLLRHSRKSRSRLTASAYAYLVGSQNDTWRAPE